MDVSMPITTVVPSLDGPVLAALAASTSPMGLAAVHTAAGRGSKSGVRSVLLRMVAEGLVQDVPGGYVLIRDHLAAPAVELLVALHGELTNRIRAAVDEWPVRPTLVGMFGSAARRDGDASSDIDVLVISEDPDLDDRVDELAEQIRRWTGNRAHVIGRTPKETGVSAKRKSRSSPNGLGISSSSLVNEPCSGRWRDGPTEDPNPTE